MFNSNLFNEWSRVHVFYDMYLQPRKESQCPSLNEREIEWRKKLISAPNGELLKENKMFDTIQNSRKTYLLHITTKLDQILANKVAYSSAGCLVGSIYSTPLTKNGSGKLSLHNLGNYILKNEARNAIKSKKTNAKIAPLVIEVQKNPSSNQSLIGIDYTQLGEIHFKIYENLKYLLSKEESFRLEKIVVERIKDSVKLLSSANQIYRKQNKPAAPDFLKIAAQSVSRLPILGYLYFEAISEYVMLYGTGKKYIKAKNRGEFYNHDYKDFVFNNYENLLENFNLGTFTPTPDELREYFADKEGFDGEHMLNNIRDRLVFLINSRLFSKLKQDWFNIHWEYDYLAENGFSPLLGHLIHRELRNFNRYQDFYFYFDQFKALQIWNYWNHLGVQLPFNGFIPKGEMGVNPAYPNLKYKIYKGSLEKNGILNLEKELKVQIAPRLVNLKDSFMRSSNEQK